MKGHLGSDFISGPITGEGIGVIIYAFEQSTAWIMLFIGGVPQSTDCLLLNNHRKSQDDQKIENT